MIPINFTVNEKKFRRLTPDGFADEIIFLRLSDRKVFTMNYEELINNIYGRTTHPKTKGRGDKKYA